MGGPEFVPAGEKNDATISADFVVFGPGPGISYHDAFPHAGCAAVFYTRARSRYIDRKRNGIGENPTSRTQAIKPTHEKSECDLPTRHVSVE
jgi:hypothetical protein